MTIGHFQSTIHAAVILGDVVTLTGGTVTAFDAGAGADACEAGWRINADGTVDDLELPGPGYNQRSSVTDWIIPNAGSSTTYYIRATEFSFVANQLNPVLFTTKNGNMGTWDTLGNGITREWSLDVSTNTAGEGNSTWVIDLEIARDSGGTDIIEIGRYTMTGTAGP